jgi:hypothetical protein
MELVLKTSEQKCFVGSNPTASAIKILWIREKKNSGHFFLDPSRLQKASMRLEGTTQITYRF